MIVKKTDLKEMPKNCKECPLYDCNLPLSKDGGRILKPYLTKRHCKCPLIHINGR